MKTIKEILEANGYTCLIGYVFEYERNPDLQNIIITKEEIENFLKQESQAHYFRDGDEYSMSEEDAWEQFVENYCEENDLDLTEEEVYNKFK